MATSPKETPVNLQEKNLSEKKGILRSLSFQFSNLTKLKQNDYDMTPDVGDYDEIIPVLGVQLYGILQKKYKKNNSKSSKWIKRFVLLKECFLLYYSTTYKKSFEKTRKLNLHPKGIIPLNGCSIAAGGDRDKKFCIFIANEQFDSAIILAAPDSLTQSKWLTVLQNATKVSYKNTIFGENIIKDLENRGALLSEEKKCFEEKLNQESKARQEEHKRTEELLREKKNLEKERDVLISTTLKLKDELQNVKNDLEITNEMKKTLEQEKISLCSKTEHLKANMDSLNIEKDKIQEKLANIEEDRKKVLLDNQNLSSDKCLLNNRLMEIETSRNCLISEKEKIEVLLKMNERKTMDLEKERQYYTAKTAELLDNLKEISDEKEIRETELHEQMMARIGAEKRLEAAEKALEHLELALKMSAGQMTELQQNIMPDVHKLKEFFERCADDARIEANRTGIMRNAIYARKSLRKTKRGRRSIRKSNETIDLKQSPLTQL